MNAQSPQIVIIGGGLAGLACGVVLSNAGRRVSILEATDRVGGRVRSDVIDGYTLDHGFQVLLTAYPACRELLDYDALRLQAFEPGALLRHRGGFTKFADPWRRPSGALASALSPAATLADKLRIGKLRYTTGKATLEDLYHRPSRPTIEYLRQAGFSSQVIDQFFRPFIGGVTLDDSLSMSSRMFEFVFKMFSEGAVAVPADGMAAIPRQLADRLPRGTVRLQHSVTGLSKRGPNDFQVRLSSGESISAQQVVVATESGTAAKLLGPENIDTGWNHTSCFYYSAPAAPHDGKWLMLRGDESGPVQSAVVISNVAAQYAPPGRALISVTVPPGENATSHADLGATDAAVRAQLRGWFGDVVEEWSRLAVYQIPFGLPNRPLDPV